MTRKYWILFVLVFIFLSHGFTETDARRAKKWCVSPSAAGKFTNLISRSVFQPPSPLQAQQTTENDSEVIVLPAGPEILILSNVFDLRNLTLRFEPAARGRYSYRLLTGDFDGSAGQAIPLMDDESYELVFRHFEFRFGRKKYDRCYINSNGNITFRQPDPDPPGIEGLLQTLPRISPFHVDLNPESAGTVLVTQSREKVVITWLRVPEFFSQDQFDFGENTFQAVLYENGTVDLVYSDSITATQGFVGIMPGFKKIPLKLVDFTAGTASGRIFHSFVENFHEYESMDIPALMRTFYQRHPDKFDFVTLFSNFPVTPVPGTQAFSINVQNNISGIGDPSGAGDAIFRNNENYGSGGQLQNITFLGNLHQYPSDPDKRIPEVNTSLMGILAHEVGHRWLSYISFPRDGESSSALLGRDGSHWSFFFNSDGSFLEGNSILQKGANTFTTGTPFQGYSKLDLYLMGFLKVKDVPQTFYVDAPHSFSPDFPFVAESAPERNVRFQGTPIRVDISDVVKMNGPRRGPTKKTFRHAFVLITKSNTPATEEEIQYVDFVRTRWESFFKTATEQKGNIVTNR